MSEVKKETKTKKSKAKETTEEVKETKKVTKKRVSKKNKVLLNEKDQKKYKILSKIIKIFTKIGRIILMIFIPFIFLFMILIPIIFKDFKVESNIIQFNDLKLVINDDDLTIKIADESYVIGHMENDDQYVRQDIINFLNNNSKSTIIMTLEMSLFLFAVFIILEIFILSYLEKIFINFINEKTPFIKENANYILSIAILLCAIKFMSLCFSIANINEINISSKGITEILIVFVMYFVFKYGSEIQEKSDYQITE